MTPLVNEPGFDRFPEDRYYPKIWDAPNYHVFSQKLPHPVP